MSSGPGRLRRNWKWLLPVPVLMVFFPVTICVSTAVLLTCILAVRSSPIYRKALKAVQNNEKVRELLGTPIQPGLLVMGNISRIPSGTMVSLSVPLSGPRGHATTFVVACKENRHWRFTTLQVQCREAETHIDLLHPFQDGQQICRKN